MAVASPPRLRLQTPRGPRKRRAARPISGVHSWLKSGAWTEKGYFALPDTNHFVELSDGNLLVLPIPTLAHMRATRELFRRLDRWNDRHQAGEVLFAPYPIRLWEEKIREPDIVFYLNEHRDRLEHQRGGPPDLAFEVLSPGTRRSDRREKYAEYAQAGVREYWIVDPDAHWIEVHTLEGDVYRRAGRYTPGQQAVSIMLSSFVVNVADLFGDPLAPAST